MTTLHDALLERRAIAEQYSQYPDDSVPVEAAMAVLLLDVAMAAEQRRCVHAANRDLNRQFQPSDATAYFDAIRDEDAALDRLREHLCGGEGGA